MARVIDQAIQAGREQQKQIRETRPKTPDTSDAAQRAAHGDCPATTTPPAKSNP